MKFIIATRTSNKIILKKAFKQYVFVLKINLIVHSFPQNSFIYQIAMPKSDSQYFNCCWPITCRTYLLWKISSHLNNVYICRFCQTESCNTFSSQWWTGRCHDPSCLQIDVSWVFVMLFSLSPSLSLPLLSNWVELITGSCIWPTHLQVTRVPAFSCHYLRQQLCATQHWIVVL